MSSAHENLLQRLNGAWLELEEAEENLTSVEQQHGSGSGDASLGEPIQYFDPEHPEVQQAWERLKRAQKCVAELQWQLQELL